MGVLAGVLVDAEHTEEGVDWVGGVVDVEGYAASEDVTGEGGVTVVDMNVLEEDEKGVELDSRGVAWAGFDSSQWSFLQQGDSRKSNRGRETLSTTTTGLKAHAR